MIEKIVEKAKKENRKVYIYAHKFPDGDAISSAQAIAQYLKEFNIEAEYVVTNPVNLYTHLVGKIPTRQKVDENSISIIVDTSTLNYAENNLFQSSLPQDIFVIDHHIKDEEKGCIEDELNIPPQNVIRDSSASSTCEILLNEFEKENINPKIANMLTLGIITDTASLRFIKDNTLKNLQTLLKIGADYEYVMSMCNKKNNLKGEVGLAKILLNSRKFKIGDTFGIIASINNRSVKFFETKYGIRKIQKKIFKMSGIENCSFNCICAENIPNEFDLEFRNSSIYGNFNVQPLAAMYGGGGHYGASGCHVKSQTTLVNEYNEKTMSSDIMKKVIERYSKQAIDVKKINLTENDRKLLEIYNKTKRFTKGATPEMLSQIDDLYKNGANYDYVVTEFKPYEIFMIQNELMSRIQSRDYMQRNPNVKIFLSSQDVDTLTRKYKISENEILDTINVFSNINIETASIILQNGKSVVIDKNGNIKYSNQNNLIDRSQIK